MSTLDDALRYEMMVGTKAIEASSPARAGEMSLRRLGYHTRINNRPQCPACWVRHGRKADMTPIGGDGHNDYLRCDICGAELAAPI